MHHWARRVGLSTLFSVAAEIMARAANTVFFVLLTWYVSETDAGRYSLGFAFALLLVPLALGGFDQLLVREAARDRELAPRLLGNLLVARAIGSVVCYAGLLAWMVLISGYDAQTNLVVAIIAATCIPESLINLYQGYLFAFERVRYITMIGIVTGSSKLLVGLVVLALGGDSEGAACVVLGASLLSLVLHGAIVAWRVGRPQWGLDRQLWRTYFGPATIFYVLAIFGTIDGVQDTLLLSYFYGPVIVGTYAAATNLISALNILPQNFSRALLPVLTRLFTTARERAAQAVADSLRLMLVLTLLISVTLTPTIGETLPVFYRGRFSGAAPLLVTLLWAFVFTSCTIPNARLIIAAGRQKVFVPVLLCVMVFDFGMNFVLQQRMAAQGAAVSRLISAAAVFLFSALYVQLRIQRWALWGVARGPLGAAALMLAGMLVLQLLQAPFLVTTGAGWVLYALGLWIFRVFSAAEIRRFLQFLRPSFVSAKV